MEAMVQGNEIRGGGCETSRQACERRLRRPVVMVLRCIESNCGTEGDMVSKWRVSSIYCISSGKYRPSTWIQGFLK